MKIKHWHWKGKESLRDASCVTEQQMGKEALSIEISHVFGLGQLEHSVASRLSSRRGMQLQFREQGVPTSSLSSSLGFLQCITDNLSNGHMDCLQGP